MIRARCTVLAALTLVAACAEGGTEERPQSEVQIAANHHLLWFRTLAGFGSVPVSPNAVFAGNGILSLDNDSTYRITTSNGTSAPDDYAITEAGVMSVFVVGTGRDPGVIFRGGYRLVGQNPDLFFTDRVTNTTSPSIGLYYGTRIQLGQVELEGDWHLLTMQTMLDTVSSTARSVGRSAHGMIQVAAGAPGTQRAISGTGLESGTDPSQIALTFSGSIQNVLDGNNEGDGTSNLSVDFLSGGNTDTRVYHAVAGSDLVLAVDSEQSDLAVGMLAMVRKFDAPTTIADISQVAGEFLFGGHTLFVNPFQAGADTFVGRLTLSPQGAFVLAAQGHQGDDFSYSGNFTLADDGGLTLTVNGTNEVWFAAINRTYDTVVLVDDVVENRNNNTPELNFGIGVREEDV